MVFAEKKMKNRSGKTHTHTQKCHCHRRSTLRAPKYPISIARRKKQNNRLNAAGCVDATTGQKLLSHLVRSKANKNQPAVAAKSLDFHSEKYKCRIPKHAEKTFYVTFANATRVDSCNYLPLPVYGPGSLSWRRYGNQTLWRHNLDLRSARHTFGCHRRLSIFELIQCRFFSSLVVRFASLAKYRQHCAVYLISQFNQEFALAVGTESSLHSGRRTDGDKHSVCVCAANGLDASDVRRFFYPLAAFA